MNNVLIGIPHGDKIDAAPEIMKQLLGFFCNYKNRASIYLEQGCLVPFNRNKIVHRTIGTDFTHILFVDSDIFFPHDALDRLLAHAKDIIGASYSFKDTNDRRPMGAPINNAVPINGLLPMRHMPTGFMLIRTSVFSKLPSPPFYCPANMDGTNCQGEDVSFCDLARSRGIDIWCDLALTKEIGHLTKTLVYPDFDMVDACSFRMGHNI